MTDLQAWTPKLGDHVLVRGTVTLRTGMVETEELGGDDIFGVAIAGVDVSCTKAFIEKVTFHTMEPGDRIRFWREGLQRNEWVYGKLIAVDPEDDQFLWCKVDGEWPRVTMKRNEVERVR